MSDASFSFSASSSGPVLAFGGEINLGRRMHEFTRRNGYAHGLDGLALLREADFSLVVLECVVSSSGRRKVDKGELWPYYYRARPEQLRILTGAGIRMVATANNHSGDYGPEALLEQASLLDAAGILHAGDGANQEEAAAPVFAPLGGYIAAIFFPRRHYAQICRRVCPPRDMASASGRPRSLATGIGAPDRTGETQGPSGFFGDALGRELGSPSRSASAGDRSCRRRSRGGRRTRLFAA